MRRSARRRGYARCISELQAALPVKLRASMGLWRESCLATARERRRQEVGHRALFTPSRHLAYQPRDTPAGEKPRFRKCLLADELFHRRLRQRGEGGNVRKVEVDGFEFAHLLFVGLLISGHVAGCVGSVGVER